MIKKRPMVREAIYKEMSLSFSVEGCVNLCSYIFISLETGDNNKFLILLWLRHLNWGCVLHLESTKTIHICFPIIREDHKLWTAAT